MDSQPKGRSAATSGENVASFRPFLIWVGLELATDRAVNRCRLVHDKNGASFTPNLRREDPAATPWSGYTSSLANDGQDIALPSPGDWATLPP